MVSINTIAILFLFGAIAIGGALAFSRIQGFFRNFQLPNLGDISLPDIPRPFVGPERMDVPFPSPEREAARLPPIDIVPEFGRQDPRRPDFEARPPIDPIVVIPDFTGGRAGRLRGVIDREALAPIAEKPDPIIQSQLNLGQFQGEAIEAPIGALSLSRIIERFDVTASQAANIRFISQQGGDPFAQPSNIFGENPPAVSDPMFQGLSLSEIAARIGQPISNF